MHLFFWLQLNGWRYKIVGDFGVANLSTDKNLTSEQCACKPLKPQCFMTACWAQLFFQNQGKLTSIGSTSGGEILLHSGL
jgi:hypothetical protein